MAAGFAAAAEEAPHSPMSKPPAPRHPKASSLSDFFLFSGGVMVALLLVWTLWAFVIPSQRPAFSALHPKTNTLPISNSDIPPLAGAFGARPANVHPDPPIRNFYDDPTLSYSIDKPLKNWDAKRQEWLRQHPALAAGSAEKILLVISSQPDPCRNKFGDHLLLFIVHKWQHMVDDSKDNLSWTSLNAGIFLIRNCQWSIDFMEVWASMGPQTPAPRRRRGRRSRAQGERDSSRGKGAANGDGKWLG